MHLIHRRQNFSAFTLIELLVVIAIIAILAVVVVLTLNPAQLLAQSRDANRVSDMATLTSAIGLYQTDTGSKGNIGSSSVVYVSLPDATLSGNNTSTCLSLGFLALPINYQYQCTSVISSRDTDGTGWIPVNFPQISSGAPFGSIPVDPTNTSSSHLYYTYVTSGTNYEVTASMESTKYKFGGSNDVISSDGGPLVSIYEKGTRLGLEPLDYGDPSLVGLWMMDEGSGSTVYDGSGNNSTGTWSGTPMGTSGFYSAGKVGPWAGTFDGSLDKITGQNTPNLNFGTGSFTVSIWMKPNSGLTSIYDLVSKKLAYNSSLVGWEAVIDLRGGGNGQGPEFRIDDGTQMNDLAPTTPADTRSFFNGSNWVHLAFVVNVGKNITFFINGTNYGTQSIATVTGSINNTQPLTIANLDDAPYAGLIDDVRLYNRALSAVEIQAMYNAGK